MDKILEGHRIFLCHPTKEEVEENQKHMWFNDYENTLYNSHGVFPISVEQEKNYIESENKNPNSIDFSIYEKQNQSLLGVVSLKGINLINRSAEMAIILRNAKEKKQGISIEAVGLILEHGFGRVNLHRVYAGTHIKLERWVEKLGVIGFRSEGIGRDAFFRDGKFSDKIFFSVLAPDFFALKKNRGGKILFASCDQLQEAAAKTR